MLFNFSKRSHASTPLDFFWGGQFSLPWSTFVISYFNRQLLCQEPSTLDIHIKTHDQWVTQSRKAAATLLLCPHPLAHGQQAEPTWVQHLHPPHHIATADTLACCCWTERESCVLEGAGTSDPVQSPQESARSWFLILAGISLVS